MQREKVMVVVVMEVKFSFNKYSQVFNRASQGYVGLEEFIIIDQYFGFPGAGQNISFSDVEFHIVSSVPTLLFLFY
jgi:hypothetical protein